MANSSSILAYGDIKEILEKALESSKGIKVEFSSRNPAIRWLSRANSFRKLDRKSNAILYPVGHTMHNQSAYDTLSMYRTDERFIEITVRNNENVVVTEL